jgi:ferredoxin
MPHLTLLPQNQTLELPEAAELTLADTLLDFSCRLGECGVCAIEPMEGADQLSPMQPAEQDALHSLGFDSTRHRLACQCLILGDVRVRQA